MTLHPKPLRALDLEFVRATEYAAIAAWPWIGRGNKNAADLAAVDAIRRRFHTIECKGLVRIGEGIKDNAPGIFTGDRLGTWNVHSLPVAIALDPIDGTTLTAKGLPGAISVLAAAICDSPDEDPTDLFPAIPSHYMQKLAVGPAAAACNRSLDIDAPLEVTLSSIAASLDKRVTELVAVVLDRPRHDSLINTLRGTGCGVRLISDGDVAAAIAPSLPGSGVDLYVGIGGSPEAVISAAAIKGLGGEQICRIWTNDEHERKQLIRQGRCGPDELERIWTVDEMVQSDNIVFAATGISDSPMLRGIRAQVRQYVTHSLLVGSSTQTMRFVETYHETAQWHIFAKANFRNAVPCDAAT